MHCFLLLGAALGDGWRALVLDAAAAGATELDRLAASAVATGEVTALKHELRDDTVELAALVAEALLAGAKRTEVLGSLGDDVVEELKVDAARALLDLLVGASDLTRGIDGSLGALPGAVEENLHDHVGG